MDAGDLAALQTMTHMRGKTLEELSRLFDKSLDALCTRQDRCLDFRDGHASIRVDFMSLSPVHLSTQVLDRGGKPIAILLELVERTGIHG